MNRHLEQLNRLEEHIQNNPNDYQSIIAYLKLRSLYIAHEQKRANVEKLREISEVRRKLHEKRKQF